MRLQTMLGPYPLHTGVRDANRPGHGADTPMGPVERRLPHRLRQHLRFHRRAQGRPARTPVPIPQQAIDAFFKKARLPAPHRRLTLAHSAHDRHGPQTIPGQKHNPRAPDMLLRRIPVRNKPLQTDPVTRTNPNQNVCFHPSRIAYFNPSGNHLNVTEH